VSAKALTEKDAILQGLVEVRQQIAHAVANIPPGSQDQAFVGVWSIKELLAHLIGWDYTNLAAVQSILADEAPAFFAHQDKDWKTYNAALVAKYRRDDFEELLAMMQASHSQLIAFLQTLDADDFYKAAHSRSRASIRTLLKAESKDEKVHLEQIQQFLQGIETTALES